MQDILGHQTDAMADRYAGTVRQAVAAQNMAKYGVVQVREPFGLEERNFLSQPGARCPLSQEAARFRTAGGPDRDRTCDLAVMSRQVGAG